MKDLVQLIRDNPGATFTVDNDCWWMTAAGGGMPIADSADVASLGDDRYGSGHKYGGDILQALAVVCGVKIESV